ncbi:hypothetical protein [Robiginitalea aurantiaca]|uniref:Uncharacterized protein n=1 Tax=Robiginitalea aurantiaca TaxID=3056915 RepID=A0ABT7WBF0_9FLAO|nr:hypothetical protein [Robiginitalea aurantiaca]MDM9630235.1 hypothetical protein [Robiginitalea aurantiaca]
MYFNSLSKIVLQQFIDEGEEVLKIEYTGDFLQYSAPMCAWIYLYQGNYAITSEWGDHCGPISSLEEALQWSPFAMNIDTFVLTSTILDQDELNDIENELLLRMQEMAHKYPDLIPGIDQNRLSGLLSEDYNSPFYAICSDLRSFLEPRSVYAGGPLESIVRHTRAQNYHKILMTYGIDTIQVLMAYFLKKEAYLICRDIDQTIQEHNRLTHNNLSAFNENLLA